MRWKRVVITLLPLITLSTGCLTDSGPDPPGGPNPPDPDTANEPPVASAGADIVVVDQDRDGSEPVTLDARGSVDPDGAIAGYVWTEGATNLGTGDLLTVRFAPGVHVVTLTVTDTSNASDSDALTVTVQSPGPPAPPPDFRVAFTGDTDKGSNARRVFELVRDEHADAMLVAGDLSYDSPSPWITLVEDVLGPDFPLFALVGNHDTSDWSEYQSFLEARADHVGATWYGDYGVECTLIYEDLVFVMLGAGTKGSTSSQEGFLADELNRYDNVWEIASWHKNQKAMQLGEKGDEAGWGVYENARMGGALIMTGHEHSYERTNVLSDMTSQVVADDTSPYLVRPGQTFATVTGLGGHSIRPQVRCAPTTYPYGCNGTWGMVYTSDQGAKYGVLFIDFHVDGDPRKARAYFKNIDGEVVDSYEIVKGE